RRAYSLSALSLGAKRGRRSFPFLQRIFVRSPGSADILFTTKTRRIAKDFFASPCLRGEISFGCGWAALCSSWFRSCFRVATGLRIPQNPGKSFYGVSDRAESIAWEHQTED